MKKGIILLSIATAFGLGFYFGKKNGQTEMNKKIQEAINDYKDKERTKLIQKASVSDYSEDYDDHPKGPDCGLPTFADAIEKEVMQDEEEWNDDAFAPYTKEQWDQETEMYAELMRKGHYATEEAIEEFKVGREERWKLNHVEGEPDDEDEHWETEGVVDYYEYDPETGEDWDRGPTEVPDEPYLISEEQYFNEMPSYDKRLVYYYVVDEVLIYDDSEEQILEDGYCFGDNWTEYWNVTEDPDRMFIRNPRLEMDFEINKIYGRGITDYED